MKDRLVSAIGALLAVVVVYALFFKPPNEPAVTRPLSTEPGPHGYLGLWTWLERSGIAVRSFRRRLTDLESADRARSGNILITTMPYRISLRTGEFVTLQRWVREGNTLLILAALDDTPEWSATSAGTTFLRDLNGLTGLSFGVHREVAARGRLPVPANTRLALEPIGEHPLMAGVATLEAHSDGESELWEPSDAGQQLVLALAQESAVGLDALWELPRGAGQIILAASGTLLENANIGTGDARKFVANLVRYHLGPEGAVIFDDMHQGLSELYDPAAFFADPRLHETLLIMLAAWLVYVLGAGGRLAPPLEPRTPPRQADFLTAAGGFLARRLDRREAALEMFDEWFAELRRARGMPATAGPPWHEIAATPALPAKTREMLRASYERVQSGGAVDLVKLHNQLREAREAIG